MRLLGRLLTISSVALLAMLLGAAQPAKAGDGGEDFGALQNFIDVVCGFFSMSSCPQTPTITQAVLQTAAFINASPAAVRADPAAQDVRSASALFDDKDAAADSSKNAPKRISRGAIVT